MFPFTTASVVVIDYLSKAFIRQTFSPQQSIPIIKNLFHLTYVKNPGAAFGLFPKQQPIFLLLTFLVILLLGGYYYRVRPREKLIQIALGLGVGGALGNLIDRLTHRLVTDFLDFRIWPVFNLADVAIVLGTTLFVVGFLKKT